MNPYFQKSILRDEKKLKKISNLLTNAVDKLDSIIDDAKVLAKTNIQFFKTNKEELRKPYDVNPALVFTLFGFIFASIAAFDYLVIGNIINAFGFDGERAWLIRYGVSGIILAVYTVASLLLHSKRKKRLKHMEDLPASERIRVKPSAVTQFLKALIVLMILILVGIAISGVYALAGTTDDALLVTGYSLLLLIMLVPHMIFVASGDVLFSSMDKWLLHRKMKKYEKKRSRIQKKYAKTKTAIDLDGRQFADTLDRYKKNINSLGDDSDDSISSAQRNSLRPNDHVLGTVQAVATDLSFKGVETRILPKDLFKGWIDWQVEGDEKPDEDSSTEDVLSQTSDDEDFSRFEFDSENPVEADDERVDESKLSLDEFRNL